VKGSGRGKQSGLPPQTLPLLYNLARLRRDNLGLLSMARDLSRHAHPRILIFRLGRTELRAIAAPDQDRKSFCRIWLVEVQGRGLTLSLGGEGRAGNLNADRSNFSHGRLHQPCGYLRGLC